MRISEGQVDVKLLTEFDQVYGKSPQKVSTHQLVHYVLIVLLSLQVVVGFCDPCTLDTNPGWPLRNFLALIAKQW